MAIDSAAKRFSAINHGCPWRGTMVVPDGSIDRPAAAYLYSGIAFTAPITVPDVDDPGTSQAAAVAAIEGVGLVANVLTAYSSTVPAGEVVNQSPAAGTEVAPGSTVTITVSLGEAPVTDTVTGGWWPDYDHVRRAREKRRREIEEAEAEAQAIADETTRQIYLLERAQEAKEADRADLDRLQKLADRYATAKLPELPKSARIAILNAQDARSRNSLEQMRRVIEQAEADEMLAVQQIVLLMLDS